MSVRKFNNVDNELIRLAVVIKLTHHFWWCIHCCRALQAPSISLVSFSLSSVCKRFHGFAASVQNQKFSPLCPHQEGHYEPPNHDEWILCLIRTSAIVMRNRKRGNRIKKRSNSQMIKLAVCYMIEARVRLINEPYKLKLLSTIWLCEKKKILWFFLLIVFNQYWRKVRKSQELQAIYAYSNKA